MIDELLPQQRREHQSWQERQEAAQEGWEDVRPLLFKECLKYLALPHDGVRASVYS